MAECIERKKRCNLVEKFESKKIYYEYGTCKMVTGVTKRQPCVCVCARDMLL